MRHMVCACTSVACLAALVSPAPPVVNVRGGGATAMAKCQTLAVVAHLAHEWLAGLAARVRDEPNEQTRHWTPEGPQKPTVGPAIDFWVPWGASLNAGTARPPLQHVCVFDFCVSFARSAFQRERANAAHRF